MAAMLNAGAPTNNTASTTTTTKRSTSTSVVCSSGTEDEEGDNPQQGPARPANATVKTESMNNNGAVANSNNLTRVPPSVKDLRKLFVGGLPQDGTYENSKRAAFAAGYVLAGKSSPFN